MDAYNRCTNLEKKNFADIVAIYGRGWELQTTHISIWKDVFRFVVFLWKAM